MYKQILALLYTLPAIIITTAIQLILIFAYAAFLIHFINKKQPWGIAGCIFIILIGMVGLAVNIFRLRRRGKTQIA